MELPLPLPLLLLLRLLPCAGRGCVLGREDMEVIAGTCSDRRWGSVEVEVGLL